MPQGPATTPPTTTPPATSPPAASSPAKPAARRPRAVPAAVSVTVTSGPDSSWSVVVSHGAKKQGKPVEITADRVARAVRELGDEAAVAAVDSVIDSAREAAQRRIAELNEELEAARTALAQLEGR